MCDQLQVPSLRLAPSALQRGLVVAEPACADCQSQASSLACQVAACGKSVRVSGSVDSQNLLHVVVQALQFAHTGAASVEFGLASDAALLRLSVAADLTITAAIASGSLTVPAVEGEVRLAKPGASGLEFYVQLADTLLFYSAEACNVPFSAEGAVSRSFGTAHGQYQQLAEHGELQLEFDSVGFTDECLPAIAVSTFEATNSVCVPKVQPSPQTSSVQKKARMPLLLGLFLLIVLIVVAAIWLERKQRAGDVLKVA